MTKQTLAADEVLEALGTCTVAMVCGLRNSGKTELAYRRAQALVAQGVPAGDVVVVVSTDAAVEEARTALAEGVTVLTARDLELQILSSDAAQAYTGRRPRLITNFENDFVKEDLKTTGLEAKRLKGMLGIFHKSLTNLEADGPHFFWEKDEQTVFNLARTCLASYGVIHPAELAGMCLHYLQSLEDVRSVYPARHFVVDDYQALNRASQLVVDALAPASLWAFADELDEMEGCDPFPYAQGIAEFVERHEACGQVELTAPDMATAAGAAALLATNGFFDALSLGVKDSLGEHKEHDTYGVPAAPQALSGVEAVSFAQWREEFPGLVERVKGMVESGVPAADVVVTAPNLTWVRSLSKAFAAQGLPVRKMNTSQLAGGNIRDNDACGDARFMALLCLLANPEDGMAWRTWCGFGDYVTRSNVFTELVTHDCAEMGRTLVEALECLMAATAEGSAGIVHDAVAEAYMAGRGLIAELGGLRGRALIKQIAAKLGLKSLGEAVLEACLAAGEDADATQMYASLYARAMRRDFVGKADGVRICTYEGLSGVSAQHLIVSGCMNGWLPEHAFFDLSSASSERRIKIDLAARRQMYSLVGAAVQTLTISSFDDVDLEVSERLNLKGYRVSAGDDGRRHMSVHRSVIADYALAAWGVIPFDEAELRSQVNPY